MANQFEMKGVVSGVRMTEVNEGIASHLMTDVVIINGIPDISSMDISKGILLLTENPLPEFFIWEEMFPGVPIFPDDSSVVLDDLDQDILQIPWPNIDQNPILGR
jgi:hypothetical protein